MFTLHRVVFDSLQADVTYQNFTIFIDFIFFRAYTLQTGFSVHSPNSLYYLHSPNRCLVYTLQAHVWFQFFLISRDFIFLSLFSKYALLVFTLLTISCLPSPSRWLVYTFQAHVRFRFLKFYNSFTLHTDFSGHCPHNCFVYTLQAAVTFRNFTILIILFLHTYTLHICFSVLPPNHFVSTLSEQMFGLHSPSTSWLFFSQIFTGFHCPMLLLPLQI